MHLHLWIPAVHADAHRAAADRARTDAVAVATSAQAGAVLLDATDAATRHRVRAGMGLSEARARCPGLRVRVADPALAARTQARIGALCDAVASAVSGDAARWDLDLTDGPLPPPPPGATGLADARAIARALARACREDLGLDAWVGVGGSIGEARLAARLARAQGDPRAAAALPLESDERIRGLPLSWLPDLPSGVAAQLRGRGIASIGALRNLAADPEATALARSLGALASLAPLVAAAAACEDSTVLSARGIAEATLAQGVWCGTRGATAARAAILLEALGTSLALDLASRGLGCASVTLDARWIDFAGRSHRHRVHHAARTDLATLAPELARLDGVAVRWERFDLIATGLVARRATPTLALQTVADGSTAEGALASVA